MNRCSGTENGNLFPTASDAVGFWMKQAQVASWWGL